jgi:hypothetical protein
MRLHRLVLGLAVLGLSSCAEETPTALVEGADQPTLQASSAQEENPFLGSWRLERFEDADGVVFDESGGSFIVNFFSDGALLWTVSNDVEHLLCASPQTDCTVSGTYDYTNTTLTMDEEGGPEPGEDTGLYTFCGGRLIYTDRADGGGIRLTYVRTRRDCYVRDCD